MNEVIYFRSCFAVLFFPGSVFWCWLLGYQLKAKQKNGKERGHEFHIMIFKTAKIEVVTQGENDIFINGKLIL